MFIGGERMTEITKEQLEILCWAFHKYSRTLDNTKNGDLWNAINDMKPDMYPGLMSAALEEIGIRVKK